MARIAIPARGVAARPGADPWLRGIGWLGPQDDFTKVGFVIALGTILGAAIIDICHHRLQFTPVAGKKGGAKLRRGKTGRKVSTPRLMVWVIFWGIALAFVASHVLRLPLYFVLVSIRLTLVFVLINGIADGISDWNPISSAFVVSVVLMASLGLKDPGWA